MSNPTQPKQAEPGYRYSGSGWGKCSQCLKKTNGTLVWHAGGHLLCVACHTELKHPESVSDAVAAAMTGLMGELAVRAAETMIRAQALADAERAMI